VGKETIFLTSGEDILQLSSKKKAKKHEE